MTADLYIYQNAFTVSQMNLAAAAATLVLGWMNAGWLNRTVGEGKAFFLMLGCIVFAAYMVYFRTRNDGKVYRPLPPRAAAAGRRAAAAAAGLRRLAGHQISQLERLLRANAAQRRRVNELLQLYAQRGADSNPSAQASHRPWEYRAAARWANKWRLRGTT